MTAHRPNLVSLAALRTRTTDRWSPMAIDGLLYAGSAVFAVALWSTSNLSPHRDWARDAIGGYVFSACLAAVLCIVRPRGLLRARTVLAVLCFVLVALVPMSLMVRDRALSGRELHVLPEVAVIERAGHLLAHGKDPYVAYVVNGHLVGRVPGVPRYEAFFPYFPAMTAFGLPSTVGGLGDFGDARLWMAAITIAMMGIGLWIARAPPDRALRAAQVMLVLPTGAIFIAGGGDDLPILAISFVGIAAVLQRRAISSAIVFGVVMAMKLTAWPLALLSLFVVRDKDGHRAAGRAAAIMAGIVAVFVIPFAAWNPRTFLSNVVEFPLGIAGVNSPAASPLPGHLIVSVLPAAHRALLIGLVIVGTPLLAWWLKTRPPTDVAGVCRLTAVVAIVVMCVAPATRVGYIVYPVNLLVWSWLFTPRAHTGEIDEVSSAVETTN